MQMAVAHPERVRAAMVPISRLQIQLLDEAVAAGVIKVADTRHAAMLIQQTAMYSWIGNRMIENPRNRVSAEETWEYCLHGLRG